MLGADGMVVGSCGSVVDERLLGGAFDPEVLFHLASWLLPETESKIDAGAGLIGVADVTSRPRTHPAFLDTGANGSNRALIQRQDIAPYGRGFADVGGDIAIEQESAEVRKVVFCALERFPGIGAEGNCAAAPIDAIHVLQQLGDPLMIALESGEHQTGS